MKLHKIKKLIDVEKFDNTNILTDTPDKLPDDISLEYVVILIMCIIKDDIKYYSQIFLEKGLYDK